MRAFELFDAFRAVSRPTFIEIESSDTLLFALACTYARNLATESIVFHDYAVTHLPAPARCFAAKQSATKLLAQCSSARVVRNSNLSWLEAT